MIWFLLFIVIVAAVPFVLEMLRADPDPRKAPGKFADLPSGRTHYRWLGPVRGPVAVCIHGLSTPSEIWEDTAEELGQTAYRVLVYDLYGRGFSQSVSGRQDKGFFNRQLEELLAHEGLDEDLTLIGYSMGAAIATAYAAKHPEQILKTILLAPSGIEHDMPEGYGAWRLKPYVGDWLYRAVEPFRAKAEAEGALGDVQRREMKRRGFFPAKLSSRRGLLSETLEREHRFLHQEDVPVMAIWGEKDRVIPLRGLGTLAQWNRMARQEVIPDAGHGLPYTHSHEVVALLREMMREQV